MKLKINIKNRWDGSIIFSHECEGNTIEKTLKKAVSEYANLKYANLEGANLKYANLKYANLRDADLEGADLEGADLRGANLRDADLRGANLKYANLRGANLRGANLRDADLRGANLRDANLKGANLRGAGLFQVVGCGSVGRCVTYNSKDDKVIAGCFYGSLDEFEAKVKETHGDNVFGKQYKACILLFRTLKDTK